MNIKYLENARDLVDDYEKARGNVVDEEQGSIEAIDRISEPAKSRGRLKKIGPSSSEKVPKILTSTAFSPRQRPKIIVSICQKILSTLLAPVPEISPINNPKPVKFDPGNPEVVEIIPENSTSLPGIDAMILRRSSRILESS